MRKNGYIPPELLHSADDRFLAAFKAEKEGKNEVAKCHVRDAARSLELCLGAVTDETPLSLVGELRLLCINYWLMGERPEQAIRRGEEFLRSPMFPRERLQIESVVQHAKKEVEYRCNN
jgi:hypothetical protein